jgi:Na+/melibiose symporter-like transporter
VERFLISLTGERFLLYLIVALFVSFSLILLIKTIRSKKSRDPGVVMLTMGIVFFFLFSRSPFLTKLIIVEFFVLGVLLAMENKKLKSVLPLIFLVGAALLVEIVSNFSTGSRFYYLDVYINALTGLSGYIAGTLII